MAKDTPKKPGDEKDATQRGAPGTDTEQAGTSGPTTDKGDPAPADKGDAAATPGKSDKAPAPGKEAAPPAPEKGGKEPDAPGSTTVIDFGKAQQEAQKAAKPAARRGRQPKAQQQEAPATSGQAGPKSPGPADKVAEARALLAELDGKQEWEMTSTDMEQRKKAEKIVAQADRAAKRGKGKPAADKGLNADGANKSRSAIEKDAAKTSAELSASLKKGKEADKAEAAPGPSLKERKAKLEAELREKFGIPKSDKPVEPFIKPETETVVRIPHEELHSFKNHPFNVDTQTAKFQAFTASIKEHGVNQPAIVRPDPAGGYEIVSGHRRDTASIEAGIPFTPCIVRALNDEQAIQQMVEDNVNNREIGTMELAKALKMQLDSIKRQGARSALDNNKNGGELTDAETVGKRSNEIVAERNGLSVKQVQRYIALNKLTPPIQEFLDAGKTVDDGGGKNKAIKIGFTTAVELANVSPKNQENLALAIDAQQAAPSLAQAKRMRELEKQGVLNGDVIDSIMCEEKKEVGNVIISGTELETYFGKDKTPTQMKEKILELLDKEFKPQEREAAKTEKKTEQPEK